MSDQPEAVDVDALERDLYARRKRAIADQEDPRITFDLSYINDILAALRQLQAEIAELNETIVRAGAHVMTAQQQRDELRAKLERIETAYRIDVLEEGFETDIRIGYPLLHAALTDTDSEETL